MPLAQLSASFVTSSTTHKQIGPFWCWFPGGWACACSRTLWVSPTNSPVKLGVSPAAASTPTGFYSQRFWGFIYPHWNPGLLGLSHSPVLPPGLSARECGTARSASLCLGMSPLRPNCPSPPLLLVWMNVSSLIPWLSDFHTEFSGSSDYFLFLNLLLCFFWLCKEAKYIYLRLHLGWTSDVSWVLKNIHTLTIITTIKIQTFPPPKKFPHVGCIIMYK